MVGKKWCWIFRRHDICTLRQKYVWHLQVWSVSLKGLCWDCWTIWEYSFFFNQTWSTQSISINNGWVFDENYKLCEDWTCAWLWDILYFKISGGQKSEVGMKKNSMTEHPADAWAGDPSTLSTKVEANAILPLRDYEVNAPTAFGKQERLIISEKSAKSAYL